MSIEDSIKNAIKFGQSNGIQRFVDDVKIKKDEIEVLDSNPINDKIGKLQKRKILIDEITQIENSIVGMHETLMNQKKIADNMMAMALGGLMFDNEDNVSETNGSFDMEAMNLASLSQSRLYSNQRDFHERVLLFKQALKEGQNTTEDGETPMDKQAILDNIDAKIAKAVGQMSSAQVVGEGHGKVDNEED